MTMMDEAPNQIDARQTQNLNPALGLAILGGCIIGLFILLKQLPSHRLTRADMDRLLFYRYLREKGKLES